MRFSCRLKEFHNKGVCKMTAECDSLSKDLFFSKVTKTSLKLNFATGFLKRFNKKDKFLKRLFLKFKKR